MLFPSLPSGSCLPQHRLGPRLNPGSLVPGLHHLGATWTLCWDLWFWVAECAPAMPWGRQQPALDHLPALSLLQGRRIV